MGTKISDGTCKEFLSEVVTRCPEAHEHYFLLDFLVRISERYRQERRDEKFILELIYLRIPRLFSGVYLF